MLKFKYGRFYGITAPMLMTTPISKLHDIVEPVGNTVGREMLSDLLVECKLLKKILKDQIRYVIDFDSKYVSTFKRGFDMFLEDRLSKKGPAETESPMETNEFLSGIAEPIQQSNAVKSTTSVKINDLYEQGLINPTHVCSIITGNLQLIRWASKVLQNSEAELTLSTSEVAAFKEQYEALPKIASGTVQLLDGSLVDLRKTNPQIWVIVEYLSVNAFRTEDGVSQIDAVIKTLQDSVEHSTWELKKYFGYSATTLVRMKTEQSIMRIFRSVLAIVDKETGNSQVNAIRGDIQRCNELTKWIKRGRTLPIRQLIQDNFKGIGINANKTTELAHCGSNPEYFIDRLKALGITSQGYVSFVDDNALKFYKLLSSEAVLQNCFGQRESLAMLLLIKRLLDSNTAVTQLDDIRKFINSRIEDTSVSVSIKQYYTKAAEFFDRESDNLLEMYSSIEEYLVQQLGIVGYFPYRTDLLLQAVRICGDVVRSEVEVTTQLQQGMLIQCLGWFKRDLKSLELRKRIALTQH